MLSLKYRSDYLLINRHKFIFMLDVSLTILWRRKTIDRMHKWRPKKYSFVYVLIRLTSLVCMYKIQKKCCLRARLESHINKRIHFWPPFLHSANMTECKNGRQQIILLSLC